VFVFLSHLYNNQYPAFCVDLYVFPLSLSYTHTHTHSPYTHTYTFTHPHQKHSGKLHKNAADEQAVAMIVIGTENKHILVLDPMGAGIEADVLLPRCEVWCSV
jgi:hypothetical protein